jgi:hypothetical protein
MKEKKGKKVIITVAITIIFLLFIGYGIEVFNPDVNREDYCPKDVWEIQEEDECLNAGGIWGAGYEGIPRPVEGEMKSFCQEPRSCYEDYDKARATQDKRVFIAAVVIGLLAVIGGLILHKDIAGTGILSGGLLVIFYGTVRYWRHADEVLKFILLGIVLAVLLWITYKKFERK